MSNPRRGPAMVAALSVWPLLFGVVSHAGPAATFEFKNGPPAEAEIRGFSGGQFLVRVLKTGETAQWKESEVRSIDFGQTYKDGGTEGATSEPPWELNFANVRKLAEAHRFLRLMTVFHVSANRQGPARVQEVEEELGHQLERTDLTKEARRDLGLARALALHALKQPERARILLDEIHRENPRDPVVLRFDSEMLRARERAERRPAPPRPEK